VEVKCQLDATEVFIADLVACSTCFGNHYAHHQELKSIIQWLLPVVFCAVIFKLLVWCGVEGYVSGCRTLQHPAIKTSFASSWHFISTCFAIIFMSLIFLKYVCLKIKSNLTQNFLSKMPLHHYLRRL